MLGNLNDFFIFIYYIFGRFYQFVFYRLIPLGGSQNLERRNVEQPIFRNFKIANIKMTKNELFDNIIF